ncbi:MAG: hypothetical protein WDM89_22400 [Rhizomicrobium sp.]
MPKLSVTVVVLLCAVLVSSCGPHKSASGNASSTPDPNLPTEAEQQIVFSAAQFAAPILMHIPPDDFPSSQVLAAENNHTVEWWTFIRSNVGCVQQGYAATIGFLPMRPSTAITSMGIS